MNLYNTSPLKIVVTQQTLTAKSHNRLWSPFGSSGVVRSILWNMWSILILCRRHFLQNLHRMVDWKIREVCNIARFVVLIRSIAWAQLIPVASPYWAMRNDLHVEAASAHGLLDNCWYPSRIIITVRSIVQRVDGIFGFVLSCHLGNIF